MAPRHRLPSFSRDVAVLDEQRRLERLPRFRTGNFVFIIHAITILCR